MNNLLNNIKEKLCTLSKQIFLNKELGKIGKVVIENDRIIVNASQKLVNKNGRMLFNKYFDEQEKFAEKYQLNKPLYFLFDGIVFNNFTILSSYNSNIIFKNCIFNNGLQVSYAENVLLENNLYINWTDFYGYGNAFLYGHFGELTFINDDFTNRYDEKHRFKTKFGINVEAKKIKIIDSNICAESCGQINIKAQELSMINSRVSGPEIYLDSKSIISTDSDLKSEKGIIIENENCDLEGTVQAPMIGYNGIDFLSSSQDVLIKLDHINLIYKRQELLQQLRILSNCCIPKNEDQNNTTERQFDMSKVLKRIIFI